MNNESNDTDSIDAPQWLPGLQLSACLFYSLILLVGVTGNILVIVIVMRYRDMRNATNLLLTNLSVADLFLLLFCTADGYQHLYGKDKHRLGKFMCKFVQKIFFPRSKFFFLVFQAVLVHSYKMPQRLVQY